MSWFKILENSRHIMIKELRETLRDRRTLFIMTLLPILLYPLLMLGMTQLIVYQLGKTNKEDIKIAVEGQSKKIFQLLEQEKFNVIFTDNAWNTISDGDAVFGIQIPADFEKKLATLEEVPRVLMFYSGASDQARIVIRRLEAALQTLFYKTREKALENKPPGLVKPFHLVRKNVAGAKKQGAFEFGRLLAVLIVLMAITFPLYPAIDMGAGEKERGTMETLLVSPATRLEIVLGKYFTIFIIAMIGSILNLGSMGITFGFFAQQSNSLLNSQQFQNNAERFKSQHFMNGNNEATIKSKNKLTNIHYYSPSMSLSLNEKKELELWHIETEKTLERYRSNLAQATAKFDNSILIGTGHGDLFNFTPGNKPYKLSWKSPAGSINKIVISRNNDLIAIVSQKIFILDNHWNILDTRIADVVSPDSKKIFILDSDWNLLETIKRQEELIDVSDNHLLLRKDKQLIVFDYTTNTEKSLDCDNGVFLSADTMLITNQQQISVVSLYDKEPLASQKFSNTNLITAIKMGDQGNLFLGNDKGLVEHWVVAQENDKWELTFKKFIGAHRTAIRSLDLFGLKCLSLDQEGIAKQWSLSPTVKFSISFTVLFKVFVLLIPLVALFSGLCLALSVFARSYKEGQHYLTPLVIVVMPMVLVALLPNLSLTPLLCIIPVVNIVLLYKQLFIGAATSLQLFLVFTSTFIYAALVLKWTVTLFGTESVIFRESEEIHWKFWQKSAHQSDVFSQNQAATLFLVTIVLFFFGGQFFASKNFLLGQAIAMALSLMVIPLLITIAFRYRPVSTFFIKPPGSLKLFLPTIIIALGGLLGCAMLALLQQKILPIDTSHLYTEMAKHIMGQPFWVLLICFALMPGICEEFFFRGLILSSFLRTMSQRKAIIITALLFAIMHMDITRLTFTFTMGIILGYLLVKTRSIFIPMVAHAVSNSTALLVGGLFETSSSESSLAMFVNGVYDWFVVYPYVGIPIAIITSATLLTVGFMWLDKIERERFSSIDNWLR